MRACEAVEEAYDAAPDKPDRGLRALALIDIAYPDHREALERFKKLGD